MGNRDSSEVTKTDPENLLRDKQDVTEEAKFAERVRWAIAVALPGFAILLGFTIKEFPSIPPLPKLEGAWSGFFVQIALVIYFWAWSLGSRSDLDAQARVIRQRVKSVTSIRISLVVGASSLSIALVFIYIAKSFPGRLVALGVFLMVDIAAWLCNRKILRPMFDESKESARKNGNAWAIREIEIVDRFMGVGERDGDTRDGQ